MGVVLQSGIIRADSSCLLRSLLLCAAPGCSTLQPRHLPHSLAQEHKDVLCRCENVAITKTCPPTHDNDVPITTSHAPAPDVHHDTTLP